MRPMISSDVVAAAGFLRGSDGGCPPIRRIPFICATIGMTVCGLEELVLLLLPGLSMDGVAEAAGFESKAEGGTSRTVASGLLLLLVEIPVNLETKLSLVELSCKDDDIVAVGAILGLDAAVGFRRLLGRLKVLFVEVAVGADTEASLPLRHASATVSPCRTTLPCLTFQT